MDGAAMDGGDDAKQRQLWCSGGASRGEARWHKLRGRGGSAATGGAAARSWRCGHGRCGCGAATVRRRRRGRTAVGRRRGGGAEENNGA
jgi:hypothetical protein